METETQPGNAQLARMTVAIQQTVAVRQLCRRFRLTQPHGTGQFVLPVVLYGLWPFGLCTERGISTRNLTAFCGGDSDPVSFRRALRDMSRDKVQLNADLAPSVTSRGVVRTA